MKELTFEESMEKLEKIVNSLEQGDVPLEKAIELFQEGMLLSKQCGQILQQVEKKIEILVEENGNLEKKSFNPGEEENVTEN